MDCYTPSQKSQRNARYTISKSDNEVIRLTILKMRKVRSRKAWKGLWTELPPIGWREIVRALDFREAKVEVVFHALLTFSSITIPS